VGDGGADGAAVGIAEISVRAGAAAALASPPAGVVAHADSSIAVTTTVTVAENFAVANWTAPNVDAARIV